MNENEIKNIISTYTPISLKEMDNVSLMKRVDTKFLLGKNQLRQILESIKDEYFILEINKNRLMNYKSLYFDSVDKIFYNNHHNKRVRRTKVRIRKYVESNILFLEVKQKDIKGNTVKNRVRIDSFETVLSKNSNSFIEKITTKNYTLEPSLWNSFRRITLVNKKAKERVTIDVDLSFSINVKEKKYDDLVIVELKQERYNRNSPIVESLKKNGFLPYSLSKYCVGMINLYDNLKQNRFKEKLIKINKISTSSWNS
ncbi:MAG: polyphosphate polymerase domain-containing protein [Flavobacteriaceae bacterium]|nr:polyphosphate polymerase domain-containing protein [Flavobacteriaceae bacterium]